MKEDAQPETTAQGQMALRKKVAKLVGIRRDTWSGCWKLPSGYATQKLPDYCNDLNAIREVIDTKLFPDGSWKRFVDHLERITNAIGQPEPTRTMLMIHASAEQRCRAFVQTMEASPVSNGTDMSNASS